MTKHIYESKEYKNFLKHLKKYKMYDEIQMLLDTICAECNNVLDRMGSVK